MSKAEDLTGKEFGYLKVLYRADDHISKSGQKKVRWMCKCTLCGKNKPINAQDLKRGTAISCGCYMAYNGKVNRNRKICIICGKSFECHPSDKTVTCSDICKKEYARKRQLGKTISHDTRKKISKKAKDRDISVLQSVGTEAAKHSPNSGRFETNVNAIDWHLISPNGKHYYFHSLNFWLRKNGMELFGCEPDSKEYNNVRSGLSGAKRGMLGKNNSCCTYKGWQVISTDSDIN